MKKIIVITIFGLSCLYSFSQETIKLLNASTLQAIEGVVVTLDHSKESVKSNQEGEFTLNLKENQVVHFNHPWYLKLSITAAEIKNMKNVVYLTEKISSYDEVVVSASRFSEKKKDVAQPIQIIRKTDLENMNQTSTADVIANTGNVMVQKSQLGGGSPIIRGFETNKVLMVVDGVRMNNAIYRGGHLQNIITLDNSVMDKIELVYGPGSVVYGSDALGGVMHFYTKNPLLSNDASKLVKGSAYTRYFSAASGYAANATVSVGGSKFGSLTAFTYSNFGNLRQGANRNPYFPSFGARNWYAERINGIDSMVNNVDTNLQIGSGYKQYDILQKFIFKQSEKVTHLLNVQYSTSNDVPRYDRLTQMSNGLPRFAQWYYGPQVRLFASYQLLLQNKNAMYDNAKIILGYQAIEESRHDRRFNSVWLNHRTENVSIYSLNADFEKKISKNELRYGAEFYYNDVQSTAFREDIEADTTDVLNTRYPDGGSSMTSVAVYATHTLEINPKLILNDGIRVNNIGLNATFIDQTFFPFPFQSISQNNNAVNGNIGLIYMPNQNWRLNGIFSTGFRAPNVDDLSKVFESVQGTVIVPNPDLKPEFTYNYELGISKSFEEKTTINVNAYYTQYKNAITVQTSTFNGQDSILYDGAMSQVRTSMNAAEAYLYGIEANLSSNITTNFSMTSSLTYTYARIKTDTTDYPLDHIPPVFGKTSFSYKAKKFRGDFWVMYSGWKRIKDYNMIGEDNFTYATAQGMPAWYTINARASYQFNKFLSLQVACENITDVNYRVFSSNISAPGRNFIITIRGTF